MCITWVINQLAFPVPEESDEFYQENLAKHKHLVWLTTSKGEKTPAIYYKDGRALGSRYTIIYSHGNAEDIALDLDFIHHLSAKTQTDVFAYEYLGYSLSKVDHGATPSAGGCKRSIEAAWKYLVNEANVPPEKIILLGRSIGSGPTVHLASKKKIKGASASPHAAGAVLLVSPIESGFRAGLPGKWGARLSFFCCCYDIFRNYKKIHKMKAPISIVHGLEDEVVSAENGKALHSKVKNHGLEPLWLEGHGHNDIPDIYMIDQVTKLVQMLKSNSEEVLDPETQKEQLRKQRLARLEQK